MHSKLKGDLEQRIAEEKQELLQLKKKCRTEDKRRRKTIEKANKKSIKDGRGDGYIKIRNGKEADGKPKSVEKEMKIKLLPRLKKVSI